MHNKTSYLAALGAAFIIGLSGCASMQQESAGTESVAPVNKPSVSPAYEMNDVHFHLTNYVQQGIEINDMLVLMGDKVNRVALFGIPLQQKWDYYLSGPRDTSYYLHTDAPLYYYSFVDAAIAQAYLSLDEEDRKRFDPMITGFNPTDMHATNHIRDVLLTYPGVFSGIGEFTIHKEFVSTKISGHAASLNNRALDAILDDSGEVGLLVILHNDVDIVYPPRGAEAAYAKELKALFKRHPDTTIIWAHTGLGRVVKPPANHLDYLHSIASNPDYSHIYFDISWDETAKYVVENEATVQAWAKLINKYPKRFLFGTDAVAPKSQKHYLKTYYDYDPLWAALTPEAKQLVLMGNYERLFDDANKRVRKWEQAALKKNRANSQVAPSSRY